MNRNLDCHVVPGCSAVVDYFVEGRRQLQTSEQRFDYFLTHFHGDHYGNLSSDFPYNIHCTSITANLIIRQLQVDKTKVVRLEMNAPVMVRDEYEVTPLEANHCPGACMLLFKLPNGSQYLHTGDMRFHERFKSQPIFKEMVNKLDTLFLDTTYADPKHTFPPQETSIRSVVQKIQRFRKEHAERRVLILIAAYNIGKERIIRGVAKGLLAKIYVTDRKAGIMSCLEDPELETLVTTSVTDADDVHVCRMGLIGEIWPYWQPNFAKLEDYRKGIETEHGIKYDVVLGILPTGWAQGSNYNRRNTERSNQTGDIHTFLVPYSEHSNYTELYECVRYLHPNKVIPTVFSDEKHAERIQKRFHNLLNHTNNKRQFIELFSRNKASSTARPKPKSEASQHTTASTEPPAKKAKQTEERIEAKQWTCGTCTLINTEVTSCAACGNLRGADHQLNHQTMPVSCMSTPKRAVPPGAQRTILSFFATMKRSS